MDKQLQAAEKQREKINKDMGNFRQDIDTQKVPITKAFSSSELMFLWRIVALLFFPVDFKPHTVVKSIITLI